MVKTQRQKKILEIISQQSIDTQHMLTQALWEAGFSSTQATISRDIRDLSLIKELGADGIYRYAVPSNGVGGGYSGKMRTIFREGVTSVETAQNLVVIRTLPGMASAACGAIDAMGLAGCVGSIAGDDTGMIAMKDSESAAQLKDDISKMLINTAR